MAILEAVLQAIAGSQSEIVIFLFALVAHALLFGSRRVRAPPLKAKCPPGPQPGACEAGTGSVPRSPGSLALARSAKQLLRESAKQDKIAQKLNQDLNIHSSESPCDVLAGMLEGVGRAANTELLAAVRAVAGERGLPPTTQLRFLLLKNFLGLRLQNEFKEVLEEAESCSGVTPNIAVLALRASLGSSDLEAALRYLQVLAPQLKAIVSGGATTPAATPQQLVQQLVRLGAQKTALPALLKEFQVCGLLSAWTLELVLAEGARTGDTTALEQAVGLARARGLALTDAAYAALVQAAHSSEEALGLVAEAAERGALGSGLMLAALERAATEADGSLARAVARHCGASPAPAVAAALLRGACLQYFAENEGLAVWDGGGYAIFSTRFSRSRLAPVCSGLCLTYLSLTAEPATSAFASFHSSLELREPEVVFWPRAVGELASATLAPSVRRVPGLEVERWVYHARLAGLEPSTVYSFALRHTGADGRRVRSEPRSFRTAPGGMEDFDFIVGGDVGNNGVFEELAEVAAATEPAFALVGGDVSYSNGMRSCYRCWDLFLRTWQEKMVTPSGLSIPMALSIGNHDAAGYSNLVEPGSVPFYFEYIQQDAVDPAAGPLPVTYRAHAVGASALLLALDTGHCLPPGGGQAAWLEGQLRLHRKRPFKFSVHHLMLFPAWPQKATRWGAAAREAWLPLFLEHNLTAGFEHHDHSLKRTRPMGPNGDGPLFLGDGNWGILPGAAPLAAAGRPPGLADYVAHASPESHVWQVSVRPGEGLARYRALGLGGAAVDRAETRVPAP